MRRLLIIIVFLSSGVCHASAVLPKPKYCFQQFKKITKSFKSKNQWKRVVDRKQGVQAYRSPTKKFAHWVQAEFDTLKSTMNVRVYNPNFEIIYKLNSKKNCQYKKRLVKNYKKKRQSQGAVTDSHLKKIVNSGQGVIYVWSPTMEYSMSTHDDVRTYSRQLGIRFYSFVDERASKKAIMKAITRFSINRKDARKISSTEMNMRGHKLHFPSSYVFKNGKIHPERIIGVVGGLEFSLGVRRRLHELR